MKQEGFPKLGVLEVATSNFGGHPPEFWADQMVKKIVSVSEDQAPHVKEQANAYRELIREVALIYINNAIKSYKTTIIQQLMKGGEEELANIIRRL